MYINFFNFSQTKNRIEFSFFTEDEEGRIFFELSKDVAVTSDKIALALSTLCGRKYKKINYELLISEPVFDEIVAFTLAEVSCLGRLKDRMTISHQNHMEDDGDTVVLNFSGGFDSLAAKYLMPADTKLVSMDFGGRFSREKEFFTNFDTYSVSTNLLETGLRKNSWSFMGIGSILYSDVLNSKYYSFGGILEASSSNFTANPVAALNRSFPPFESAGMKNAPYVLGLTEIGTIKVIANSAPHILMDSLDSLANPGEEKRYRKQVLLDIYCSLRGKAINYNKVPKPVRPHFKFGQNFSLDFLALYVAKFAGIEVAQHTVSEIPCEAVKIFESYSFDFYEKLNTKMIENFPTQLIGDFMSKLRSVGIDVYNSDDWEEFYSVRDYLGKYHEIR